MSVNNNLTGLVVCGGSSSRMGFDKSMLTYYSKPQKYHLYEMLRKFCSNVYISCNRDQVAETDLPYISDAECFTDTGPAASLMSAFTLYTDKNFLIVGCDYPFIKEKNLKDFLASLKGDRPAAAFYNEKENLYEPLLAFYSSECSGLLKDMFKIKQYSLQYFLKAVCAEKYIPSDIRVIKSADTPEDFIYARSEIDNELYPEKVVYQK